MNDKTSQLATIRIQCNGEKGTALLFFPGPELEYVYVFTAKHCLTGKEFNKGFAYHDILLDKILNPTTGTYHSCRLTETDVIQVSDNLQDIALIIMPKQRILELTGVEFYHQVINTHPEITHYRVRGFASFNEQETDRPFDLKYQEDQKGSKSLFTLKSGDHFDTFYNRALDNLEGLSGSGVFAESNGNNYLVGIMHLFEDGNVFTATKVIAYNQLIDTERFSPLNLVIPETNLAVLHTFQQMVINRETINTRTRDTIGSINVPRDMDALLRKLEKTGMAVVHGKPGVGKSALAKSAVASLHAQSGVTVIAFTPEQLYCETLREALTNAGYTADMEGILNSPLSGNKVVIWVESFEKLIESGYSGAFKEILKFVETRTHVKILVTIRDYLLQKLKITYRFELPAGEIYYALDVLSEQEINSVRYQMPEIGPLLDKPELQELLRIPYYLDKAARIIPELLGVNELDEIKFKLLMWEHIVEAGNRERGAVFSAICLKRAKELSLFTSTQEPAAVVAELVKDNILQEKSTDTGYGYSPSHDILEDWALIHYIGQRRDDAASPMDFIRSLEQSPAVTRAFRLWLDEYYKNEPQQSAVFVQRILLDQHVERKWKNVLLTATLRSAHAAILFDTLGEQLLNNQGQMLREVINLLQTSCKTFDHASKDFDYLIPVGSGWDYILKFIRRNLTLLQSFKGFEFTYLSVIESWIKQLPDFNPTSLPPAAEDAGALLEDFIHRYQDKLSGQVQETQDNSLLKRYVVALFKLTGAATSLVKAMLEAALDMTTPHPRWTNRRLLKSIRRYAITGMLSDQLCKYFPTEVIRIADADWREEETAPPRGSIMSMIRVEPELNDFGFGDNEGRAYDFSSGYQTFLYWMLLYHPEMALDFLMTLLNRAFDKNQQIRARRGVEIVQITIVFADGTNKVYYGCNEYWAMYRGVSSRHHLVSSLLMALEKGLLHLADTGKEKYPLVRKLSGRMINETNNVAVLGVVASLLQAHPDLLDEQSVCLFGMKDFYRWDGSRWSSELLTPDHYHEDPLLKQERLLEDKRPFRKKYYQGMVGFVAHYMFAHQTHNQQLFALIDKLWADLDEKDEIWRKFLFDMDVRRYTAKRLDQPGHENMVQFMPGYDEKVQQMMSSPSPYSTIPVASTIWTSKIFNGEEVANRDYATWKTGYDYVQGTDVNRLFVSSGTLATIGLRDFADQLSLAEMVWCQQELLRYGRDQLKKRDYWDFGSMAIDKKEAMFGLSLILKTNSEPEVKTITREMIFRLLVSLHGQEKEFLAAGMTTYLPDTDPSFLRDSWYGILEYIIYEEKLSDARIQRREMGYIGEVEEDFEGDVNDAEWFNNLVQSVVTGNIQAPNVIAPSLRTATKSLLNDALYIIPANTTLSQQQEFIQHLFQLHIDFLNDRGHRSTYEFYECRSAFVSFYPRYLLAQPQDVAVPLFTDLLYLTLPKEEGLYTDKVLEFVYDLVKQHIIAVDRGASITNFWALWERLRHFILQHKKGLLMPLFLLDIKWNPRAEQWYVLDGRMLYYREFIINYGFNRIDTSIKLLSGIGFRNFMPDSVSWVRTMLHSEEAMSADVNLIDEFILKAFYGYGSLIKGNKEYLSDFINILDIQIVKRSSKAYMLKEELIQYKLSE